MSAYKFDQEISVKRIKNSETGGTWYKRAKRYIQEMERETENEIELVPQVG
jgi:hypothetical protein